MEDPLKAEKISTARYWHLGVDRSPHIRMRNYTDNQTINQCNQSIINIRTCTIHRMGPNQKASVLPANKQSYADLVPGDHHLRAWIYLNENAYIRIQVSIYATEQQTELHVHTGKRMDTYMCTGGVQNKILGVRTMADDAPDDGGGLFANSGFLAAIWVCAFLVFMIAPCCVSRYRQRLWLARLSACKWQVDVEPEAESEFDRVARERYEAYL